MAAGDNPFPDTPFVTMDGVAAGGRATVVTSAVRTARELIDARAGGPGSGGLVLAIVGEPGTGKSHLAGDLVARTANRARTEPGRSRQLRVDGAAGGFARAYSETLIGELIREEVLGDLVEDYFADVTASHLERLDGLRDRRELIEGLRARHYDARKVIERFYLSESEIRDELRRRLHDVTGRDDFSRALALLHQGGFQTEVWAWLAGLPPSEALRERGIVQPIEGDLGAFAAFGTLTMLFARQGHRLELFVDEFDAIVPSGPGREEVVRAVKKLADVFIEAGGLLVFCALPSTYQSLPSGLRDRAHEVRLAPFGQAETEDVIRLYQDGGLFPHTPHSAAEIRRLSGGNPREILRLLHRTWRPAPELTAGHIRASLRVEPLERAAGHAEVRRVIEDALVSGGWRPQSGVRMAGTTVDHWIRLAGNKAVAVLVADSLIDEDDVARVRRRVVALREEHPATEVVVVTRGYAAPEDARAVAALVGRDVLAAGDDLGDAVRIAVEDARRRLSAFAQDEMALVLEGLERANLQHIETQRLARAILGEVSAGFDRLAAAVPAPATPGGAPAGPPPLPPRIEEHFAAASSALGLLTDTRSMFAGLFRPKGPDAPAARGVPRERRLTPELYQAIGVAVLYRGLLEEFRAAVAAWFRDAAPDRTPGPAERDELHRICFDFTTAAQRLPLFQLDRIAEQAPFAEPDDGYRRITRSYRRATVKSALQGLGDRVFRAAVDPAPG
ncbi:hypothetical protein HNP84_008902 [Thermocatellispora tengchongensis]|uniref:Uncharacterized protein n=1 Tax=Thermocatellispora tengchongensis TaxID=1073253 RepID=A0A840PJJ7_9ACTN|nr:hypothetical protein [Thermocatellispora tengchongensis]MBB5139139.1 hypothetical protein [Thermocatellispora tengchongensis]